MSLSPTNITKIGSDILEGVTPYEVEIQVAALGTNELGATLTADKISQIEAAIAEWDAGLGDDFTDIEPNVRNFGASIRSERARNAIRNRIAAILERPDWGNASGGYQFELTRG